jgi:hypothetical protein
MLCPWLPNNVEISQLGQAPQRQRQQRRDCRTACHTVVYLFGAALRQGAETLHQVVSDV